MTHIRIAAITDAERVTTLARDTFVATFADSNTADDMARYVRQAFAEETIRSELADAASTFFWAEAGGLPAGYAKLHRGLAEGCVTGSRALELQRLYAAREFYRRQGFVDVGEHRFLLGTDEQTDRVMQLDLRR